MSALTTKKGSGSSSDSKQADLRNGNPTIAMVARCDAWKQVVGNFTLYLKSVESVATNAKQQEIGLTDVITKIQSEQFLPSGSGSIVDIPPILQTYHHNEAKTAEKLAKVIETSLLPRLKKLDLGLDKSITDFQGLAASLTPPSEASSTEGAQAIEQDKLKYAKAIEECKTPGLSPSVDPYVLKTSLEQKIKTQLLNINQVADARAYAKDAIQNVDKSVSSELQSILRSYADTLGKLGEGSIVASSGLFDTYLSKPPTGEFEAWLKGKKSPKAFTDPDSLARKSRADLSYANEDSSIAKPIKKGTLERRTKYLRSFVANEYVLTPSTLIELKQGLPEVGIDLTGAKLITENNSHAEDPEKFVLNAKQVGSTSGRSHTWVFRSKDAAKWKKKLAIILEAGSPEKAAAKIFGEGSTTANSSEGNSTSLTAGKETAEAQVGADPVFKDAPEHPKDQSAPGSHVVLPGSGAGSTLPTTDDHNKQTSPAGIFTENFDNPGEKPVTTNLQHADVPAPTSTTLSTLSEVEHPEDIKNKSIGSESTGDASKIDAKLQEPLHSAESGLLNSEKTESSANVLDHSSLSEPATQVPTLTRKTSNEGFETVKESESVAGVLDPAKSASAGQSSLSRVAGIAGVAGAAGGAGATASKLNATSSSASSDAVDPAASTRTLKSEEESSASDVSDVPDEATFRPHVVHEDVIPAAPGTLAWQAQRDQEIFKNNGDSTLTLGGTPAKPAASTQDTGAAKDADNASVWSYDLTHEPGTLKKDRNFTPVDSDIPPHIERRLTQTEHKNERPDLSGLGVARTEDEADEPKQKLLERRRSSVSVRSSSPGPDRRPSRMATGSYGDLAGLKPLTSSGAGGPGPLFFAGELPKTTSGASS